MNFKKIKVSVLAMAVAALVGTTDMQQSDAQVVVGSGVSTVFGGVGFGGVGFGGAGILPGGCTTGGIYGGGWVTPIRPLYPRPHWHGHYHPGRLVPHGGHFDYIPGHFHGHRHRPLGW